MTLRTLGSLVALGMLAWPTAARAWELGAIVQANVDAEVADLDVATVEGQRVVVVVGPTLTALVDAASGDVLSRSEEGGRTVAVLPGESTELAVCGADGLFLLPTRYRGVMDGERLSESPCLGVALTYVAEDPRLVTVGTEATQVWARTSEGWAVVETLSGEPDTDRVLIAAAPQESVAWAVPGQPGLREWSAYGLSTVATGGVVRGLAHWDGRWVWTVEGEAVVLDATRRRFEVAPDPSRLASGTLLADGTDELLVLHPSRGLAEWVTAPEQRTGKVAVLPGASELVVGLLDDDDCGDLATATVDGAVWIVRGEDCDAEPLAVPYAGGAAGAGDGAQASAQPPADGSSPVPPPGAAQRGTGPAPPPPGPTTPQRPKPESPKVAKVEAGVDPLQSERASWWRPCSFTTGAMIGFVESQGNWTQLGQDTFLTGSPTLGVQCEGGRPGGLWWAISMDTAPWFQYSVNGVWMSPGLTMSLTLGVDLVPEVLQIGAHVVGGITFFGLGAQVQVLPFKAPGGWRHGPLVRGVWVPGSEDEFALAGSLQWAFQLGPSRSVVLETTSR